MKIRFFHFLPFCTFARVVHVKNNLQPITQRKFSSKNALIFDMDLCHFNICAGFSSFLTLVLIINDNREEVINLSHLRV